MVCKFQDILKNIQSSYNTCNTPVSVLSRCTSQEFLYLTTTLPWREVTEPYSTQHIPSLIWYRLTIDLSTSFLNTSAWHQLIYHKKENLPHNIWHDFQHEAGTGRSPPPPQQLPDVHANNHNAPSQVSIQHMPAEVRDNSSQVIRASWRSLLEDTQRNNYTANKTCSYLEKLRTL